MKKLIIIGGITIALVAVAAMIMHSYTKSFSPADTSTHEDNDLNIVVNYCRPFKKGREVFGSLVPFGEVWRTGANEPTTFSTNQSVKIKNQVLEPGTYSLWTIPQQDTWTVIINSKIPGWGVKVPSGKANRDPENDVLKVDVPAIKTQDLFEQFTISFDQMNDELDMVMMWENTLVVVPIQTN
ncbi:MAG: DUF2911 domain-containing protein [Bacteroidota bacterium]